MELLVLGCGDAFGNDGRFHTSFLVSQGQEKILLDCGASTLIRLKQENVDLEQISTIIITHFHGDHFGGLPFFLISSLFESSRRNPLTIIGPKGVEDRVLKLLEAMYEGTSERLQDLDISFQEYDSEIELLLDDKKIVAVPVDHSPQSNPHGVRVEWKGKTFAFSGDTSWTDKLLDLAKDSDLFICECNFVEQVAFGHLSYSELLEKQHLFQTKQLWLSHMANEVIYKTDFKLNRMKDGQRITF
ncbi:MAG: MBL fold metallo-hydrolase [Ekhidna sp.]|nr:MBL fold metallo-hydrolase [Ekhidna sp.]